MKKTIEIIRDDKNFKKLDKLLSANWIILYVVLVLVGTLILLSFFYFINIPEYMMFLSEYAPNEVNVIILNGFNQIVSLYVIFIVQFIILGIFTIFLVKKIEQFRIVIENFEKSDSN